MLNFISKVGYSSMFCNLLAKRFRNSWDWLEMDQEPESGLVFNMEAASSLNCLNFVFVFIFKHLKCLFQIHKNAN